MNFAQLGALIPASAGLGTGLLDRAFDTLDQPRQLVAQLLGATDPAGNAMTGRQILEGAFPSSGATAIGGFGLDMAMDPFTWLGFGLGGAGRAAGRGLDLALESSRAARAAGATADDLARLAAAAESHVGPLRPTALNMGQGYQSAKALGGQLADLGFGQQVGRKFVFDRIPALPPSMLEISPSKWLRARPGVDLPAEAERLRALGLLDDAPPSDVVQAFQRLRESAGVSGGSFGDLATRRPPVTLESILDPEMLRQLSPSTARLSAGSTSVLGLPVQEAAARMAPLEEALRKAAIPRRPSGMVAGGIFDFLQAHPGLAGRLS